VCDIHFQQDIVIHAEDSSQFEEQKLGFVDPRSLGPEVVDQRIRAIKELGLKFYGAPSMGIGRVQDETRLFYTKEEGKTRWSLAHQRERLPLTIIVRLAPSAGVSLGESVRVTVCVRDSVVPIRAIEVFVNEVAGEPGATRGVNSERPWYPARRPRSNSTWIRPASPSAGIVSE
jgi:hypothetical protein